MSSAIRILGNAYALLLSALLGSALAGGCRSVALTAISLQGQSVEVHLVGINPGEYRQWYAMDMGWYWEPTCELRKQAVAQGYAYVMHFGQGKPTRQVLEAFDPIWRGAWQERNARDLFVLANLSGDIQKGPGDIDARRKIHPIGPWPMDGRLEVLVDPSGIILQKAVQAPRSP